MTPARGTLALGIDTGGTYTDAVLHDARAADSGPVPGVPVSGVLVSGVPVSGVVAKAKALTTRHDLAIGIAGAVGAVLAGADVLGSQIGLVSLSTTLATNALVEGRGGRVALVFIGFGEHDATRAGLTEAMRGDPVIRIAGGHNPQGDAITPLDVETLEREALAVASTVTGFAVTAQFATRNAEHEIAARDLLRRLTGLPVTCGHELSAKLNGPRRAVTSVLNARLIGLITGLIAAAEDIMARHGIDAPLMVVRGDGALMSAAMAKTRPIETILSGPAASLVGAAHLTGLRAAVVSDIGGTTTDVAVIERGVPHLDENGATVGGHRTMVEAVAMTTVGLGGDSEIAISTADVVAALRIGPRRVVPIALLAVDHGELVHRVLDQQLLQDIPGEHDARFVVPLADAGASTSGLDDGERQLLERALGGVVPVGRLIRRHADAARLDRLVSRGLVLLAGFTPTDAAHVTGEHRAFDRRAAEQAATLMARRRTLLGKQVAIDGPAFAAWVIESLQRRSAEVILDVGLGIDGFEGNQLSRHPLLAASLDGRHGVVEVAARLTVPLVGLGASAALHYPAVARLVRTEGIIPADADVANAVGAVVGQVRVHSDVYISQPTRGVFRVHHGGAHAGGHDDVTTVDESIAAATRFATAEAVRLAGDAGAIDVEVAVHHAVNTATVEGEDFFVDATVTATATGRPRVARQRNTSG